MKNPKKIGSFFKIGSFSMDIESLTPINPPLIMLNTPTRKTGLVGNMPIVTGRINLKGVCSDIGKACFNIGVLYYIGGKEHDEDALSQVHGIIHIDP